jgi:Lon protease-like protein
VIETDSLEVSGPSLQATLSSIITSTLSEPTPPSAHGGGVISAPSTPSFVPDQRYSVAGRTPPEGREAIPESREHTRTKKSEDRGDTLLVPKNKLISSLLDDINIHLEKLINLKFKPANRDIDPKAVDSSDFECALCFRLLWQPVTTSCGHTYCKSCLDRSLDHRSECPLCKTKIETLGEQLGVNDFVDHTIRRMLPKEFVDRQRLYEEEISDLGGARKDGRVEIPIFVCTMSFPSIPCPLHVFEPRYRLMIRRAMESGAREFGMSVNDPTKGFAEYGTMLEIRDIQYFADGRSVVDTMGSRRFHVFERGTRDGYSTAVVEFLKDDVIEGEELTELRSIHERTRTLAVGWFGDMDRGVQMNVTSHYGPMPRLETEYWKLASGPAWVWWVLAILPLDTLAQQQILSQTKLKRRLEAISRILGYMKRRGGMPS